MKTFTIGEIASLLNLNVETLYFYDRKGLLPFVKRDEQNRRQFTADDLEMILTILHLKNAEVPLRDIKQFIEWRQKGDSTLGDRLEFIQKEEQRLDQYIEQLHHARQILKYKEWYYQTALEAGTESIHLVDGTYQYNKEAEEKFLSMIDNMSEAEKLVFELEQKASLQDDA